MEKRKLGPGVTVLFVGPARRATGNHRRGVEKDGQLGMVWRARLGRTGVVCSVRPRQGRIGVAFDQEDKVTWAKASHLKAAH